MLLSAGLTAAAMAEALKLQKMRMMMGFHSNRNQQRHHNVAESENDDTGVTSPTNPQANQLEQVFGVKFSSYETSGALKRVSLFPVSSLVVFFPVLTSWSVSSTPCLLSLSPVGGSEGSWEKEQHLLPPPSSGVAPSSACLNLNTLQQHSSLLTNRELQLFFD